MGPVWNYSFDAYWYRPCAFRIFVGYPLYSLLICNSKSGIPPRENDVIIIYRKLPNTCIKQHCLFSGSGGGQILLFLIQCSGCNRVFPKKNAICIRLIVPIKDATSEYTLCE